MNVENCTPAPGRLNYVPGVIVLVGPPDQLNQFERAVATEREFRQVFRGSFPQQEKFPTEPPIYYFNKRTWKAVSLDQPQNQQKALEVEYSEKLDETPNQAEISRITKVTAVAPSDKANPARFAAPQIQPEARRYKLIEGLEALSVTVALLRLFEQEKARFNSIDVSVDSIFHVTPGGEWGNSPTLREPPRALFGPNFNEKSFGEQACFERIHFNDVKQTFSENPRLPYPQGEGVTIAIIDSSPALKQVSGKLIDFWIDLSSPNSRFARPLPDETDPVALPSPLVKSLSNHRRVLKNRTMFPANRGVKLEHPLEMERFHGLMVASLIRYLAPKATIVLIKVMNDDGEGEGFAIQHALKLVGNYRENRRTVNGRRIIEDKVVINLSLGARGLNAEEVEAPYMLNICDWLCRNGAIMAVATGNDSWENHPLNPEEPAAYGYFADTEATDRNLVCVAATDGNPHPTRYAWFSNQSDLGAPGHDLVLDLGVDTNATGLSNAFRYVEWSGSSFATPLVSGGAAMLLGAGLKPEEVKMRLWSTATPPEDWNCVREINLANAFAELSFLAGEPLGRE